jgi:hypothetical protein
MNRKPQGCFSGCGSCLLWAVVLVLLVDGWEGGSWPLRAVEILGLVVIGIVALAVRAQRGGGKA